MELLDQTIFPEIMPLKILAVAATSAEAGVLTVVPGIEVIPIVTGVGSVATAWAMTKHLSSGLVIDLALNIGIAGSYDDEIRTGDVVLPVSDCFADAGIETKSGFLTLAEAGLQDPDAFPFKAGRIFSENTFVSQASRILRPVNAVTVNTATGSENRIKMISQIYHPDIETMEGAAFFYICSREKIPFIAIRAISNLVEPRDRDKWNIPLALGNLSVKLKEVLLTLG
jgi:futalosine hydrolase